MRSFRASTYGGNTDISAEAGCVAVVIVAGGQFRHPPRDNGSKTRRWLCACDPSGPVQSFRAGRCDGRACYSNRHPSVVTALGKVVVDLGSGPLQRFALSPLT